MHSVVVEYTSEISLGYRQIALNRNQLSALAKETEKKRSPYFRSVKEWPKFRFVNEIGSINYYRSQQSELRKQSLRWFFCRQRISYPTETFISWYLMDAVFQGRGGGKCAVDVALAFSVSRGSNNKRIEQMFCNKGVLHFRCILNINRIVLFRSDL